MEFDKERQDIYFEALVRGEIDENTYKQVLEGKAWVKGARVRATRSYDAVREGYEGTICKIYPKHADYVGIRWDKDVRGHDCDGNCEKPYGWNLPTDRLELI